MLHDLMEKNVLFYGMIGAGILGILCIATVSYTHLINIMTGGGPGNSTTVLAHYIYLSGFRYHKMGYASAMAWFLLLIIFLVTLFQWKIQRKHEEDM